jgi:putative phosphonate metabolism protein
MGEWRRHAIYFAPAPGALAAFGAAWLGRDAESGRPVPAPTDLPAVLAARRETITAAPRRYGFHATLKAPFRLAEGATEAGLERAMADFAGSVEPVVLPRIEVAELDGFLALVPAEASEALQRFAGSVVEAFEPFRAPSTEAEISRRNPDALDPERRHNLIRWGYPYVFGAFQFHMTLTGRLAPGHRARFRAAAETMFAPATARPLPVDGLALFVEPEPGAPFTVRSWHALGRQRDRMTA